MDMPLSRRSLLTIAATVAGSLSLPARALFAEPGPAHRDLHSGLTFLAVGDWGNRGSETQRAVAAAMARRADQDRPRFVISLGDNFYKNGVASVTDAHWQESFEEVYDAPSLQVPWYPVLGNHDRNGEAMAQVAYSQLSTRWRMPGPFYVHSERLGDGSKVDFFFLDTQLIVREHEGLRELVPGDDADDQLAWLGHALGASQARWKIVVGHHPIYSGGPHGGARELVRLVKPLLDQHHVAAYLCGHDHNMQHVVRDGIHYVTCGTGATLRPTSRIDGTVFHAERLGFIRARLTPLAMELAFVDAGGSVLHEAGVAATS